MVKRASVRTRPKDWEKAVDTLSRLVTGLETATERNRIEFEAESRRIAEMQFEVDRLKAAVERLRER